MEIYKITYIYVQVHINKKKLIHDKIKMTINLMFNIKIEFKIFKFKNT